LPAGAGVAATDVYRLEISMIEKEKIQTLALGFLIAGAGARASFFFPLLGPLFRMKKMNCVLLESLTSASDHLL
jgi:hypothetical protein